MTRIGTPRWTVDVLPGWAARHDPECISIERSEGVGSLQISGAVKEVGIVNEADLLGMIDGADAVPDGHACSVGEFSGFWMVLRGGRHVLAAVAAAKREPCPFCDVQLRVAGANDRGDGRRPYAHNSEEGEINWLTWKCSGRSPSSPRSVGRSPLISKVVRHASFIETDKLLMNLICPKCKAEVFVPDDLSAELKEEIGSIARENSRPQAMFDLNNKTHMGLRDAKAIVMHLTDKNGLCHRCKTQLAEGDEYCPQCQSLNLQW